MHAERVEGLAEVGHLRQVDRFDAGDTGLCLVAFTMGASYARPPVCASTVGRSPSEAPRVHRAQRGQQLEELKHDPDRLAPPSGQALLRHRPQIRAVPTATISPGQIARSTPRNAANSNLAVRYTFSTARISISGEVAPVAGRAR